MFNLHTTLKTKDVWHFPLTNRLYLKHISNMSELCPGPYTEKTKGAFGGAEGAIWGFGSTENQREPKYRRIQHNSGI